VVQTHWEAQRDLSSDQVRLQSKTKYLGLGEVSSKTLRRAHAVHTISAVQVEYSQIDLVQLNTCKELGVAIMVYSPLGRGFLDGVVKSREHIKGEWRELLPRYSEENFPKSMAIVEKIKAVAGKKGVTKGRAALAWLMAQWEDVIPVPGIWICALEENVEAMKIKLTKEIKEIRRACENAGDSGGRYLTSELVLIAQ
jgi:aryl-alcohol dehydrogenase-like predicted oxidoreductase